MLQVLLLVLSAIVPVGVFLFFIYRKDTEKEPLKLLGKCLLWGCIIAIPAVLIDLVLGLFNVFHAPFFRSFYEAFVVAALVEELLKFLCLYWIIWKHKEFDQFFDGIVYAVFVSLGFALVENIGYVLEHGFATSIVRAILAVPGHGLYGVVMGYFFSLARFATDPSKRKKMLWLCVLLPVIFHGIYDFILMYTTSDDVNVFLSLLLWLVGIAFVIYLWKTGLKYIKEHHAKDIERIKL